MIKGYIYLGTFIIFMSHKILLYILSIQEKKLFTKQSHGLPCQLEHIYYWCHQLTNPLDLSACFDQNPCIRPYRCVASRPSPQEHLHRVSRLLACSLQCYQCADTFLLFCHYPRSIQYLSFVALYEDDNRLFSLNRLDIISPGNLHTLHCWQWWAGLCSS